MKLPALDDLIDEQWDVYRHPADVPLFVVGPPGSGKTSLAIYRARRLAEERQTVMLVTKNRMLVSLAQHLGEGVPFQAKTMCKLISRDHSQRCGSFAPERVSFDYKWDEIVANYEQRGLTPTLDHCIVDEGQNLPPGFFRWVKRFGARILTVFADENQTSTNDGSSLSQIAEATSLPDAIRLTANHRNTPEIAAVAEYFHDSDVVPPAIVRRAPGGETPRIVRIGKWDELVAAVVTRFTNRGESIGVIAALKDEVTLLESKLRAALPGARVDHYTSNRGDGAEGNIRMLDPGVTVLTGESSIGLEFDAVFLTDLSRSLPCTKAADHRRMYMLCARARDALFLVDGPQRLRPEQEAALPPRPTLER